MPLNHRACITDSLNQILHPTRLTSRTRTLFLCRYGFVLADKTEGEDTDYRNSEFYDTEPSSKQWAVLLDKWRAGKHASVPAELLKRGIPNQHRGEVWGFILDVKGVAAAADFSYYEARAEAFAVRDGRLAKLEADDAARIAWAKAYGTDKVSSSTLPNTNESLGAGTVAITLLPVLFESVGDV